MVRRVRDGDTIEISLPESTRIWAIRLIDCWAPELSTEEGKAARDFCEEIVGGCKAVAVYIPPPRRWDNLLKNLTFDRIPAWLFLDSHRTLNDAMVKAGYAWRTKQEQKKTRAESM